MASIPMYRTIGQQSTHLADKLFNTINRRNELKSQGKLAELQVNLQREERNFASEQQRLRDRDYQKFQAGMQDDRQAHAKQQRIATQSFQSVEAKRRSDEMMQRQQYIAGQQRKRDTMQFEHDNLLRQMDWYRKQLGEAKTKEEKNRYRNELNKVTNLFTQRGYGGITKKMPAMRSSLQGLFPQAIPGHLQQATEAELAPMIRDFINTPGVVDQDTGKPFTYKQGKEIVLQNMQSQGLQQPPQTRQFFDNPLDDTLEAGQYKYGALQSINRAWEGAINPIPKKRGFVDMIPEIAGAGQQVMNPFTQQRTAVNSGTSLYDPAYLQQFSDAYRRREQEVYGGR